MGMFDRIECKAKLPDGFDPEGRSFQTKCLNCDMATYEITEDGRLVLVDPGWYLPYDEKHTFQPEELSDFHDDIQFYDGNVCASGKGLIATEDDGPPWWGCYIARFTNGRLEKITGGVDYGHYKKFQHVPRKDINRMWHEMQEADDG